MSASEAQAWAAGSKAPGIYFHGTTAEHMHPVEKEGFSLTKEGTGEGHAFGGEGVYLTKDNPAAWSWAGLAAGHNTFEGGEAAEPAVLQTAVNVSNPADAAQTGKIINDMVAINDVMNGPRIGTLEFGQMVTEEAQKQGFDALQSPNRDELVVFDPHNVTVIGRAAAG